MRSFAREKYRVVQWATGNQGRFSLDMLTNGSHPHLDLIGCWVHSASKVGLDAGEAAGLHRETGVLATHDTDALIALRPDAVIYSGFWSDADLFCRLLESGINVVTQVGPVYMRIGGRRRARIEKACAQGGSTFFAGGINTGFFSDRLAASLTSLNGEVSHIEVVEYSPGSLTGLSEYMIFDAMGFGWTRADLDREQPKLYSTLNDSAMFAGGDFLGAALGFEVDERHSAHEFIMADQDYSFAGRAIAEGTVAGVRTTYTMLTRGVERVRYSQAWTIDGRVKTEWPYAAHPNAFYQIRVTGTPSYNVFWEPDGDGMYDALYSTAATVVNAVPFACDASVGVHTQIDLPMLSFSGTVR
ncbi:hypothetical protein OK015_02055 [Mycobacterium sp. Aquia_216]|uniref:hypothetical protein n=1 Tax=Mycobacterium sp. Aquia_216 TaxID=2991729 RepID=UPI00227D2145|nr:hypothetical protein [Mycobacterium sp. Aquia_216]WAJ45336.1 hypothetical protein OK015_02055 [Mycobacterium sp. Aquia_216]